MELGIGAKSKKTLIVVFEMVVVLALLVLGALTIALNPTKLRIGYGVMLFLFAIGESAHFVTRVYSFYVKDPVRIIACCFPDNHWLHGPLPTTGVRRFRNIPMILLMLLGFINTLIANFNDSIWLEPAGWFYLPLMIAILGYGAAVEYGPRNFKFYGGMGFLSLAILALGILGLFL
jgi:hypothetical protein